MKPSAVLQAAGKTFLAKHSSTNAAAKALGVSRDAITRLVAGLDMREGTLMLLSERLKVKR